MKPSHVAALIRSRLSSNHHRPIHLEGSPGLGKTQIPAQIARESGIGFLAVHAPMLPPEDLGFPVINSDRTDVSFVVSKSRFPLVGSSHPARGILLVDELAQADAPTQKALANLFQEREIHGHSILPGWLIISTGNRSTDRSGASRLLSHLANRLTRIPVEVSLDDWCAWALTSGIRPEVIAFIRFRPALLSTFDPNADINATPRAWSEGISPAIGNIPPELELASFTGDIGEGPASEFIAFLRIFRNLPDLATIEKSPQTAQIPSELSAVYALTGALVSRLTPANFPAYLSYVSRLSPEFSVMFTQDALKRLPVLADTPAYITWATTTGKSLLI
jgi:hypothetical protein